MLDARSRQRYALFMATSEPPPPWPPEDKRSAERVEVSWSVDCDTEETFLYASITNISAMGIFVRTDQPLSIGTLVRLRFGPPGATEPFSLRGRVQWINKLQAFGDNPNPGMGILFLGLTGEQRERLVAAIRTIAYLRSDPLGFDEN
jgi:type IV pilus assembly protein PilZ